jgi:hypothetical protein
MDPNDIRDYQEMVWHKTLLRNQAEEERIRIAQKKLHDERQNALEVIREYMYKLHHKQRVAARESEYIEELRMDTRASDKSKRRAIRIAGYEYAEWVLMHQEDVRSKEAQRLYYEEIRENNEINDMFMNEYDQTHTSTYSIGSILHEVYDKFWGIDIYDMKIREKLERERLLFIQKIEDLR